MIFKTNIISSPSASVRMKNTGLYNWYSDFKTSVSDYPVMQSHTWEEQSSQLYCSENLKAHKVNLKQLNASFDNDSSSTPYKYSLYRICYVKMWCTVTVSLALWQDSVRVPGRNQQHVRLTVYISFSSSSSSFCRVPGS